MFPFILYKSSSVKLVILQVPLPQTGCHLTQATRWGGGGIHVVLTHFWLQFFFSFTDCRADVPAAWAVKGMNLVHEEPASIYNTSANVPVICRLA